MCGSLYVTVDVGGRVRLTSGCTGDVVKTETGERIHHKRIPLGDLCGTLGLERGYEPIYVPGTGVAVENRITGAPDYVVQGRYVGLCLLFETINPTQANPLLRNSRL